MEGDDQTPTTSPAQRRLIQIDRMTEPASANVHRPERPVFKLVMDGKFITKSARPGVSEDRPYPMTREEALHYMKTRLNIPDPETQFTEDKVGLLNRVIERLKKTTPFTNLHNFMTTQLWDLDEYDLKRHMLSGEGGPCTWINPFTKALLERLGYKVHHICGYNPGVPIWDNHISTIVEDLTHPGSLHLVDPGTRRPLNAAIPLDFEKESPEYRFNFLTSKFFKEKGGRLIWCARASTMTLNGKYIMYDAEGKAWKKQLVYFMDERRNWYPFIRINAEFYRAVKDNMTPPFNGLVFFAYIDGDSIINVLAYGDSIVKQLYKPDGSLEQGTISKQELLRFFKERFPQYSNAALDEVFSICPFS